MATYGSLSELHLEVDSIAAYLEQVEVFFAANEIPAERRVAVFLSVVGERNVFLAARSAGPCQTTN